MALLGAVAGLVLGAALTVRLRKATCQTRLDQLTRKLDLKRLEMRERKLAHDRAVHELTLQTKQSRGYDERRQRLNRRMHRVDREESRIDKRGEAFDQAKANNAESVRRTAEIESSLRDRIEARAKMRASECQLQLRNAIVARYKEASELQPSAQQKKLSSDLKYQARALLRQVLDRYDGVSHVERPNNSFELTEPMLRHYGDANSELFRLFSDLTRCGITPHLESRSITLHSDNPLARELGRRVFRQINKQKITTSSALRTAVETTRASLDGEVRNAGTKAVRELGLDNVAEEIRDLVGRLKFRLSYSQNQWKHSIEVAHFVGLLSGELNLLQEPGRRAGLMHDMGKALSHEREDAHAVVAAAIAERNGETEEIRHAIGAHHYDEEPSSALAFLVIGADAMSGARPGARRDSKDEYHQRIREIEAIVRRETSVSYVDVAQGGREVRATVVGTISRSKNKDSVSESLPSDEETQAMAKRIAATLSQELVFAGEIRVTVIRESQALSVARQPGA